MRRTIKYDIVLGFSLAAFLLYVFVVPFALTAATDDTELGDSGSYSAAQKTPSVPKVPTGYTVLPVVSSDIAIPLFLFLLVWLPALTPFLIQKKSNARAPPLSLFSY